MYTTDKNINIFKILKNIYSFLLFDDGDDLNMFFCNYKKNKFYNGIKTLFKGF